jgi:hypothetical protein
VQGLSRESSHPRGGKQEVAVLGPAQDTQLLKVEDKEHFAENPPSFEDFQGKIKTAHFVRFDDSNKVQRL